MDGEPHNSKSKYIFEPLLSSPPEKVTEESASKKLISEIQSMERKRPWSGPDGIKGQIGEENGEAVEVLLKAGNITLVEVGAGKFVAAREIAQIGQSNTVMAVEPLNHLLIKKIWRDYQKIFKLYSSFLRKLKTLSFLQIPWMSLFLVGTQSTTR